MTMWWSSSSGQIELQMTLEQAKSVSHSGQCYADVKALQQVPAIKRQLSEIDAEVLRAELREYGAWGAEELANHEDNLERVLWIAGCDISEEQYMRRKRA
jgi:hypothetical protein